jgi:uncharacterized glyoxalase superfamily protein PhnB
MKVGIAAVVPMLQANDLEETIRFYTQTLGFEVEQQTSRWCSLWWDQAELMFYEGGADSVATGMSGLLYFYPDDVEALWEQLKGRVAVERELQMMEYGMLEFAIRDCNGYILSFGESAEPEAA